MGGGTGLAIFNHFALIATGITMVNAGTFWLRGRTVSPELQAGYRAAAIAYATLGNLPWVVMLLGDTLAHVTLLEYFNPRAGNPWVLAFHGTIIFLWALTGWWVFGRGGAEFLAVHRELIKGPSSPQAIKAMVAVMLLGGLLGIIGMWSVSASPRPL